MTQTDKNSLDSASVLKEAKEPQKGKLRAFVEGISLWFEIVVYASIAVAIVIFMISAFRSHEFWSPDFYKRVIRYVDLHWKGALILIVPLFFGALTRMIDRIVELPWVKLTPSEKDKAKIQAEETGTWPPAS